MRTASVIQLLWSLYLLNAIGRYAFVDGSTLGYVVGIASGAYVIAAAVAIWGLRFAWVAAILLGLLPLLRWLPMVVINFWMFFTGHELYQDSPATILIVASNAIRFVLPGVAIYTLLLLDHKRFARVLFPGRIILNGHSVRTDRVETAIANPYSPPGG